MVVPALLTEKRDEYLEMLEICAQFTDYVQVDIMDGEFVPSKSISLKDLGGLKPAIKSEAHLMVSDPCAWLKAFKEFGAKKIIFHFEIDRDHKKIIKKIREEGFQVGIGINPSTELKDFEFLLPDVDSVLFLSVDPGFYGSPFIGQVLEKVKVFRRCFPQKFAGIDGGIKLDNAKEVIASGVDYICVGSAILKAKSPAAAYLEFKKLI